MQAFSISLQDLMVTISIPYLFHFIIQQDIIKFNSKNMIRLAIKSFFLCINFLISINILDLGKQY